MHKIDWSEWEIVMWHENDLIALSVKHLKTNIKKQGKGNKYLELRTKLMEDVLNEINKI